MLDRLMLDPQSFCWTHSCWTRKTSVGHTHVGPAKLLLDTLIMTYWTRKASVGHTHVGHAKFLLDPLMLDPQSFCWTHSCWTLIAIGGNRGSNIPCPT
eukprot:4542593-Amphidinium_carterae.1